MLLKCCSFSAGLTDGWSTAQINSGMKGMEAETLIWGCCRSRSQRWRDQSAERHYKWGKSWKQLRLSLGRKFLASFVPVSSLFFSFLPIFFFWLGWWGGLWHNASASGGSSNTLLWPKYSSVARWLAKRRSRSGGVGGVGVGLGWCGTSTSPVSVGAPLKFKYLSELEIDPFLWLSLPLCCHSSVTPPLQFLPITVSSLHPSRLQHRQEE